MNKKTYNTPVCRCIRVNLSAPLTTSVLPTGTQAGNNSDATKEDWNEENKNTGSIGVGGDEFSGNNW